MGSAVLYNAAHMQAIENATVVSMVVNSSGHLIVTRKDTTTFDAGDVSTWLPGRLKTANNLGAGNDPNALLQNGWYAGTNWANSLLGYTFGIIEVLAYDASYIVQNFFLASNPGRQFTRSMVGGSWTNWVEKNAPATTTLAGEVVLATGAEATTGTDPNKVVTPLALTSALTAFGVATKETLTGQVSPTWTTGLAPVTFDTGQNVTGTQNCLIGRGAGDVMPGDNVVVEHVGTSFYIVSAALSSPVRPIQIPLVGNLISATNWIDYKDQPGTSSNRAANGFEYGRGRMTRTSASWVSCLGLIAAVTARPANDVVFTLPLGFRPLQRKRFICYSTAGQTGVIVETNGQVIIETAMAIGVALSLTAIKFTADATISWTNFVLASPHVVFGGTDATPRYGKDATGKVITEGFFKGGTTTATNIQTTALPAAYQWSAAQSLFMAYELSNTASRFSRIDLYAAAGPGFLIQQLPASNTGRAMELDWLPDALAGLYISPVFNVTNYNAGFNTWGVAKLSDGTVRLKGLVVNTAGNQIIGWLPPGYRPADCEIFANDGTDQPSRVDIFADGRVVWVSGTGSFVSLENISFVAEQ